MNGPDAGHSVALVSALVAVLCRRPAEEGCMPLTGPEDGLTIASAGTRSARIEGVGNGTGTDESGNGGDSVSVTGEG